MVVVLLVALIAFAVGVFVGSMLLAGLLVHVQAKRRADARAGRLRVHNGGRR